MNTQSSLTYIAVRGDTWDSIAFKNYLQERMATIVLQANPTLSDIIVFDGGEAVTVPIVAKVISPDTLPPWRR